MYEADGRGSIGQRRIFDMLKQLYKQYRVIWEQPIKEINMRFDMFIKEIGLAVEVDGTQHDKFNQFFHKDDYALYRSHKADEKKNDFCEMNGIKLIRLTYPESQKITLEEFKQKIDSTQYPESDYTFNCLN